ncbi:PAS domain S-box-containing protein/diguanylate cyclase (GGDEF) domain-containing protein [Paucidesulfovibrio gracilis DSM 16080]|uniref:PAS domain S-box-containing protein/diguanylate cyclase (GGDEF) domain-containing protein n=1 Tax=Paucidesulfovibrio gracilis DSM 16080 TaxID=1121449 RepID=A0A1T4Y5P8_9BACT|nr:EAL domain-containing protein [Paucidesulfovibrio gracilis]SKA96828.1 PAS domain S-box-containing protein/diguanylate cyclase (GGDEF) domain-containing protein [Paucidesulfovibrio gracilis DSM 16080]
MKQPYDSTSRPVTRHWRLILPMLLTVGLFFGAMHLFFLPALEESHVEQSREACRKLTQAAHAVLVSYGRLEQTGRLSPTEAREAARRQIRSMRYGPNDEHYFWISDMNARLVMHPYRAELEGQDLSEFSDDQGTRLFQRFADVAREQGQGFVAYRWQWNNESERVVDKVSYVKAYAPWGWIVGTGVYLDDIQAQIAAHHRGLLYVTLVILTVGLGFTGYIALQARRVQRRERRDAKQRESLLRALGEQERLYRSLVDNITTGVALLDSSLNVKAVNRQMLQWFPMLEAEGYPPCGTGKPLSGAMCETCVVRETFQDGENHERVGTLRVQGRERRFRVIASPVRDISGEIGSVIEMFEDITDRLEAEEETRRAEERYRGIFENAVEGLFQLSPEGRFLTVNPAMASMVGRRDAEDMLRHVPSVDQGFFTVPEVRDAFLDALEERDRVSGFEAMVRQSDGNVVWLSLSARVVRDEAGSPLRYEGSAMDVTQRRMAELEAASQRAHFQQLFERSPLGILLVDEDGLILDANPGFTEMFGHEIEALRGGRARLLLVPEKLYNESKAFQDSIFRGRSVHKETTRRHASGKDVPVSVVGYPFLRDGEPAGAYYIYQDITERKSFERQLAHQAFHDALTALPNRSLYMERLAHALERRKRREDYHFAALMIDLNRFKRINDTHGHQAGDQLLVSTGLRLLSCIRTVDTVARLGGDEFAVLLEEFDSPREVIQVTDRITKLLDEPVVLDGQEMHTGASIGIVLDTRGYERAEDILRDADIAMYQAKERNRPRLVFNRRMHAQAARLGRLEAEMRRDLDDGRFVLHYQPIYSATDGALQGFEALARWEHPERGLLGPQEFIPLAEETGLIIPLGRWVIREACRQMASWRSGATCGDDVSMSVNISARQFSQPDLVEFIRETLEREGLSPCFLKLEITESVLMREADAAAAKLRRLKELGIKLMIDDFGTGYSSLSYLQRFPVDYLKIDRSFISGDQNEEESRKIVSTIISLARNLGLRVVAEGVEEQDQFQMLRNMQCDDVQGFMFSRPVESPKAQDLLESYIECLRKTDHEGTDDPVDTESPEAVHTKDDDQSEEPS